MAKQFGSDSAMFTAYEDHKNPDISEPEKNLMRAILRSAMDDIQRDGDAKRQAKSYFLSDGESYLYSFQSICNQLDLCEQTILDLVGLKAKNASASKP